MNKIYETIKKREHKGVKAMIQQEIIPPKKIMVLSGKGGIIAAVRKVIIHPKGSIKVIKSHLVPVELKTDFGSRFYGFKRAYIGSDLQVHCSGYSPNFEELKTWKKVKEYNYNQKTN